MDVDEALNISKETLATQGSENTSPKRSSKAKKGSRRSSARSGWDEGRKGSLFSRHQKGGSVDEEGASTEEAHIEAKEDAKVRTVGESKENGIPTHP